MLTARPCDMPHCGTHTTNAPEPGTRFGIPGNYAICDTCAATLIHSREAT